MALGTNLLTTILHKLKAYKKLPVGTLLQKFDYKTRDNIYLNILFADHYSGQRGFRTFPSLKEQITRN